MQAEFSWLFLGAFLLWTFLSGIFKQTGENIAFWQGSTFALYRKHFASTELEINGERYFLPKVLFYSLSNL